MPPSDSVPQTANPTSVQFASTVSSSTTSTSDPVNSYFRDRVVLVTGGSGSLGSAVCEAFARRGAKVVVNYAHDAKRAEDVVWRIRAFGGDAVAFRADVSDAADAERLVRSAAAAAGGRLDAVVTCARDTGPTAPLGATGAADWRRVFAVNVDGLFHVIRAAGPLLAAVPGGGCVVAVVSGGCEKVPPMRVAYAASQNAAISVAKGAARECGNDGVRVNCVAAGRVRTEGFEEAVERVAVGSGRSVEDVIGDVVRAGGVALGRLAEREEVANAAVFLASGEASGITGAVLEVGGGMW